MWYFCSKQAGVNWKITVVLLSSAKKCSCHSRTLKTFDTSLLCLVYDQTSLLWSYWGDTVLKIGQKRGGAGFDCRPLNTWLHTMSSKRRRAPGLWTLLFIPEAGSCWSLAGVQTNISPRVWICAVTLRTHHSLQSSGLIFEVMSSLQNPDFCEELCFVGPKVDQLKVVPNVKLFIFLNPLSWTSYVNSLPPSWLFLIIGTSVICLLGSWDDHLFFVQTRTTNLPPTRF